MPIESATDILMALLYSPGKKGVSEEIRGITKIVKLLFLLEKEGGFKKYFDLFNYKFEAYNFGPYSDEIFGDIEMLKEANLLEVTKQKYDYYAETADRHESIIQADSVDSNEQFVEIFSLTSDGKKIGKSIYENDLTEEEKQKIEQIKTKYNSIPLYNLLKYVYKKYPEVTTESVIRDKYPS